MNANAKTNRRTLGSSAEAIRAPAPQRSADAEAVALCAARLLHCARLAESSAAGAEPEYGAVYILDVLEEIAPKLPRLRRLARSAA